MLYSTYFYRNPRLLILTICLILVGGLAAFQLLPRLEDPELTQRFATIRTIYPGASPDRVESLVTDPIEEELDKLDEIKVLESRSNAEISIIQVELRDDIYDVEPVWSKVRDKLNDVNPQLPSGAFDPVYEETFPRAYAIIVGLKWTDTTPPNYAILRRLTEELEEKFRTIGGTEDTKTYGDPEEEILVEVDSSELTVTGLTPIDIARIIEGSDAKVASGQLRGEKIDLLMEIDSELDSVSRVSNIPVFDNGKGELVPLKDLAKVSKGFREPLSDLAIVDGKPAVVLGVLVESSRRIDLWAAKAREMLTEYESHLPKYVEMDTIFDQSTYTEQRLSNLLANLGLGASAVMIVILIMMGWREALLVGAALPLSSLLVLSIMNFMGIPLHQMSVTGLIIALGLLIDNAIVTVDEVKMRIEDGMAPIDAVADTVRFLLVPLLGSTITTMLSFAPIALMPGPAGEFVGTIAKGVIIAIFSSLFVSLTIIVTITGWSLKTLLHLGEHQESSSKEDNEFIRINMDDENLNHSPTEKHAEHKEWIDHIITPLGIPRMYRAFLGFTLRHRFLTLFLCLLGPVMGFVAGAQLQEQFFPPSDRDQFKIDLELPVLTSLGETRQYVEKVRKKLLEHDEILNTHWFLGRSAPIFYYNMIEKRENASNYAQAMVQLKSPERYFEVIQEIQKELDDNFPEARFLATQLEQGPPFDAPVEVRLYGPNLYRLVELGNKVRQTLTTVPHVVHTMSDLSTSLTKLSWKIDEEQASLAGLSHAEIARQLSAYTEGIAGGSVFEGTEELPVRVRVKDFERSNLEQIRSFDLQIKASDGRTLPLSAIANVNITPEISSIPRINRRRVNIVQASITSGTLPQDVLDRFLEVWDEDIIKEYPGYSFKIGGEAAERDEAVGNLMGSVGILGTLMVATLVMSFSSFRLAALIGSIGLLSVGWGMASLWVFGYPFGFMAIIGVMGLIGIAINDSIVVLSAIVEHPLASSGNRAAIVNVTVRATRHIVSTTLTTIAGFVPLIMAGGGQWPPLAIAISGGVSGATILGLIYVPVMYSLIKGGHGHIHEDAYEGDSSERGVSTGDPFIHEGQHAGSETDSKEQREEEYHAGV